jgi:superfamily II DNA or RNA helicase
LLTATPYNNRPQDLFALIKLFQTPNHSTLSNKDNLNVKFRALIAQYNKLYNEGKKGLTNKLTKAFKEISEELRLLISPVIIRRSRIDLAEINEYAEDLKVQEIQFPTVMGPELLKYDLHEVEHLYHQTLLRISDEFKSARYNAADYLINPKEFNEKYGHYFEQTNIELFQGNLAQIVKHLLVMRFESSQTAFKSTLKRLLISYQNMKKWYENGYVIIKSHGSLPDPESVDIEEITEALDNEDDISSSSSIKKDGIKIPIKLFKENYYDDLNSDIALLNEINDAWFEGGKTIDDPKFNLVFELIVKLLKSNSERKIVIFSSFADTAEYVQKQLEKNQMRALLYTGGSNKTDRNVVSENFDASYSRSKNDYDIIVATDALSEGFNLSRAGVIINYDIPYNPTRVIQRIGRINRINKMMFDKIYIYNLFPTEIGERVTLTKGISTLKMLLITNIVGNDTKTLTQTEELQSYFKKQYDQANASDNDRSWDNEFKNIYDLVKHNTILINKVRKEIPERSRIVRKNSKNEIAVSFAKRGDNSLFATAKANDKTAQIVSPEIALALFKADIKERPFEFDDELEKKFRVLREEIHKTPPKLKINVSKSASIKNLNILRNLFPHEKDYIDAIIENIEIYDDLCDGELKYLSNINIKSNTTIDIINKIKAIIPVRYLNNSKTKADNVGSQLEVIMFTEDLRH